MHNCDRKQATIVLGPKNTFHQLNILSNASQLNLRGDVGPHYQPNFQMSASINCFKISVVLQQSSITAPNQLLNSRTIHRNLDPSRFTKRKKHVHLKL